jgi:hypothetical protein
MAISRQYRAERQHRRKTRVDRGVACMQPYHVTMHVESSWWITTLALFHSSSQHPGNCMLHTTYSQMWVENKIPGATGLEVGVGQTDADGKHCTQTYEPHLCSCILQPAAPPLHTASICLETCAAFPSVFSFIPGCSPEMGSFALPAPISCKLTPCVRKSSYCLASVASSSRSSWVISGPKKRNKRMYAQTAPMKIAKSRD